MRERPVQLILQFSIFHRLDHEIHRPHLIAVDGVLGQIGDKDQRNILAHLAQAAGGVQSIQMWHVDIHQDDVKVRLIVADKAYPVGKTG